MEVNQYFTEDHLITSFAQLRKQIVSKMEWKEINFHVSQSTL